MSDDDKKATDAADGTDTLKQIGGSQSESSPHTRSANALADGIASLALARRFNIRVNVADWKSENLNETAFVAVLRLKNPKPPMTWKAGIDRAWNSRVSRDIFCA
jgi:hypothetical protein